MRSPRTLCFLLLAVLGLCLAPLALAQEETAAATADCNGEEQGECANPDVVTEEAVVEEDPNCPSRESIIRCAGKHLDTNQNGKLDRPELESAIASLPWYARGILQILGSVDKMVGIQGKESGWIAVKASKLLFARVSKDYCSHAFPLSFNTCWQMKKCDVDGDDAISMDYDMHHNKDQCLASCFKRKAFKNSFFPDCQ
jgi:hypothetical protein